jgi:hypothetical protein
MMMVISFQEGQVRVEAASTGMMMAILAFQIAGAVIGKRIERKGGVVGFMSSMPVFCKS